MVVQSDKLQGPVPLLVLMNDDIIQFLHFRIFILKVWWGNPHSYLWALRIGRDVEGAVLGGKHYCEEGNIAGRLLLLLLLLLLFM